MNTVFPQIVTRALFTSAAEGNRPLFLIVLATRYYTQRTKVTYFPYHHTFLFNVFLIEYQFLFEEIHYVKNKKATKTAF